MTKRKRATDSISHRPRPQERTNKPILGKCAVAGKTRWASRRAAREQLLRLRSIGTPDAAILNVYRCSGCGDYHVGHRPSRLAQEGRD